VKRTLLITIDTEVDKNPAWRVSSPASFQSVVEGIPEIFTPLFDRYGAKPTYFLSPEVIENPECVRVLASLGDRAELATHLHAEFAEPERSIFPHNMSGSSADALQRQYSSAVEAAKLEWLTERFVDAFGYAPTAFRAGRYGMSDSTLGILAALGYVVDSSVTPGLRWNYDEGVVDYRQWSVGARRVETNGGPIIEIPVSILPGSALSPFIQHAPALIRRIVGRIGGERAGFRWLRPSWSNGERLVRYVDDSPESVLNLMFHSMEIIPGASPYASTAAEVGRILGSLDTVLQACAERGIGFGGITDVARRF
jgi:hypothetical protein